MMVYEVYYISGPHTRRGPDEHFDSFEEIEEYFRQFSCVKSRNSDEYELHYLVEKDYRSGYLVAGTHSHGIVVYPQVFNVMYGE